MNKLLTYGQLLICCIATSLQAVEQEVDASHRSQSLHNLQRAVKHDMQTKGYTTRTEVLQEWFAAEPLAFLYLNEEDIYEIFGDDADSALVDKIVQREIESVLQSENRPYLMSDFTERAGASDNAGSCPVKDSYLPYYPAADEACCSPDPVLSGDDLNLLRIASERVHKLALSKNRPTVVFPGRSPTLIKHMQEALHGDAGYGIYQADYSGGADFNSWTHDKEDKYGRKPSLQDAFESLLSKNRLEYYKSYLKREGIDPKYIDENLIIVDYIESGGGAASFARILKMIWEDAGVKFPNVTIVDIGTRSHCWGNGEFYPINKINEEKPEQFVKIDKKTGERIAVEGYRLFHETEQDCTTSMSLKLKGTLSATECQLTANYNPAYRWHVRYDFLRSELPPTPEAESIVRQIYEYADKLDLSGSNLDDCQIL